MNPIWYRSVAEKHKVTGSFSSPQLLGNVEAPSSEKTEMRLIPVSNLPNSILLGEGCLIASDLGHSPPGNKPLLTTCLPYTTQYTSQIKRLLVPPTAPAPPPGARAVTGNSPFCRVQLPRCQVIIKREGTHGALNFRIQCSLAFFCTEYQLATV